MIDNRLKKERFRDDIIKRNGTREEEKTREKQERVGGDQERFRGKQERVRGKQERAHGDQERVYGKQERVGGDQERPRGKQERTRGKQEREHGGQERAYGKQERTRGKQGKEHGGQERAYGKQERAYMKQEREHGTQERAYGTQERAHGTQERTYGTHERAHGNQERAHGNQERTWSKGDMQRSDGERKQRGTGAQRSRGDWKEEGLRQERELQRYKGEKKQGEKENPQDKGKMRRGKEEQQQRGAGRENEQGLNEVRQKNSGEKERSLGEQRKSYHIGQEKRASRCPVFRKCGGCQLLDMPYEKQLEQKQRQLEQLLKPYCRISPIIGMKNPDHYRNKVHAVFDHDKKGNPISGVYEQNSHRVVPVESCLIEDQKADEIIGTIRGMLKSFKIRTYDEDTGYGLLRHVLIRRGFATGEIMVVLVTASPIFPSKNNFVKALREKHPEITTVIQNVNDRGTSMVLGDKEQVLYGKGYIEDILCGCRFRISSKSFYQVNPVQTEVLYKKAIEAAGLTGKERVIDAYCGIGTIGIVASRQAKEVISVELNRDAVRDAIENAKINDIKNVRFFCNDAGKFMINMADSGEHVDVVFMDPPRSGSTEEFIDSVDKMRPEKVVYVSCGPETLVRDLEHFRKKGYEAKKAWGIDMFPGTTHVECIIMMQNCGRNQK